MAPTIRRNSNSFHSPTVKRFPYLALIDESGEQLRLVSVNDKAFQEANYFGMPIYDFRAIPKDTYRNLQAPSGEAVETLVVKAVMLISSAWSGNHADGLDTVIEGVERAIPIIRTRVAAQGMCPLAPKAPENDADS